MNHRNFTKKIGFIRKQLRGRPDREIRAAEENFMLFVLSCIATHRSIPQEKESTDFDRSDDVPYDEITSQ